MAIIKVRDLERTSVKSPDDGSSSIIIKGAKIIHFQKINRTYITIVIITNTLSRGLTGNAMPFRVKTFYLILAN